MGCGCSRDLASEGGAQAPQTMSSPVQGIVVQGGSRHRRAPNVTPLILETDPDLAKLQLKNQQESSILKASGMMQNGDFSGAIKELTATLTLFPQSARAHLDRGICYHRLKELDNAVGDFTRAIELQQGMYLAYTHRARVYLEQGRCPDAIEDCKSAMDINGENPEAYSVKVDAEEMLEAQEGDDTVSDVFGSPCKTRERKTCVVCMDEERGCRLHPCMHAALCVECAIQLQEKGFRCPICDCAIEEVEPGAFMDTFAFGDQKTLNDMISAAAEINATYSPLPSPGVNSPVMWPNSPARPSSLRDNFPGGSLRESWTSSRGVTPHGMRQPSPLAGDSLPRSATVSSSRDEADPAIRSLSPESTSPYGDAQQNSEHQAEDGGEVDGAVGVRNGGEQRGEGGVEARGEGERSLGAGGGRGSVQDGVDDDARQASPGRTVIDYSISFDMEGMAAGIVGRSEVATGSVLGSQGGEGRMVPQRENVEVV